MKALLLAAALSLAADPRADFLAGKPLAGDGAAAQVQKGRYALLEQVAREWGFTPEERAAAEALYGPKAQGPGAAGVPPQPPPAAVDHQRAGDLAMGRAADIASRLRWDRSAGDMPSGVQARPAAGGAYRPDYRALNAQPRGGPTTVRVNEVPLGSDVERLTAAFEASVQRMNEQGLRRAGTGELNGFLNNMQASLVPGSKKVRCYDQAEQLVGDLDKLGLDRRKWTYRIRSYSGDGHEANGHYWVEAVSKDPKDPTVVMDPWKNSIKTIPQKEELVIKPYSAFWMGWVMDKVGF